MVSGSRYLMDFPLPVPVRYRASGNGNWEDDPGMSFRLRPKILKMLLTTRHSIGESARVDSWPPSSCHSSEKLTDLSVRR
jgi:hypothetical protein